MASSSEALKGVEAYIFDVFGTVVDWYGNITSQLAAAAPEGINEGSSMSTKLGAVLDDL